MGEKETYFMHPWKINMEPKNDPIEKENNLPNYKFWGYIWISPGCILVGEIPQLPPSGSKPHLCGNSLAFRDVQIHEELYTLRNLAMWHGAWLKKGEISGALWKINQETWWFAIAILVYRSVKVKKVTWKFCVFWFLENRTMSGVDWSCLKEVGA